jgi:hypothetical protein
MNRRRVSRAAVLTAALILPVLFGRPADLLAQQGVTTGSIVGRIVDNTGAPLAGATVTVRNVDTGTPREAQTNADGRYTAGFLQPGDYNVTAAFPPLPAEERGPVRVSLGESQTIDFAMRPVEVEAIGVVLNPEDQVDVTEGGVVELVDEEQIENLPALGRDFTDFIALSGLVSPAPEVGTGGQFALGGGRTSATNVQIDGADANNAFFGENRGSSRIPFTFSLESIKEFQIVTNGFDVEFGDYTGGVVNAVTKGGSNEFEGSAFVYGRDQSLTANTFAGQEPEDFSAQQFGFHLGGPIVRDKAHFFVSLDGQQRDQPVFAIVPTGQAPNNWPADSVQRFKDILRDVYGVSQAEIDANIGTFEETEDETSIFARIDWQASERNLLTVRHNYTDFENLNDRVNPEEALSHGGDFDDRSNSFVSELTSVLGGRGQGYNTFRFQWSDETRPRPGNNLLPEVDVEINQPSEEVEFFGDGTVFRNQLDERKFQLIDNLTWQLGQDGRHTMKLGTNNTFTKIENLFWLNGNGIFRFTSLANFENRIAADYMRNLRADEEPPFAEFNISEWSFYAQDEWQATDQFLLTLGLRYDTDVFNDEAEENSTLRDSLGLSTATVPEDNNNVGPRVAFTYDLNGDERSVLRGGVGLLYGRAPFVLHGNVMQAVPPLLSLTCRDEFVPEPDYDLFRQTPDGSNNPAQCAGGGQAGGAPQFAVWDEDFENPESWKFNLGYEQVVGDGWRLSSDFLYGKTTNNFNVSNVNIAPEQFRTAVDNRPVFVAEEAFGCFNCTSRGNPAFAEVFFNEATAESDAYSLTLKAGRNFAERGLRFTASYTANWIYDNTSFFCCTSGEGFSTKEIGAHHPNEIGEPGDEDNGTWGPADFERRHVWVLTGIWQGPWGIDVSGTWRSQSGTPWTMIVEGDINGDDETFNDRAPIFQNLQFESPEEAAQWNALLAGGAGEAGECLRDELGRVARRNSCRNPWFHSVDLHLAKAFGFGGGQEIELIADLFNVLNGLSEDWGKYEVIGLSNAPLSKEDYDPETNNVIYSVNDDFGALEPLPFTQLQFQAQLGARYRF